MWLQHSQTCPEPGKAAYPMVTVETGILSADVCERLARTYDRCSSKAGIRDYNNNPVVYYDNSGLNAEEKADIRAAVNSVMGIISPQTDIPIHPETVTLVRTSTGGHFIEHADNCKQMPDGTWMPNHTPNRHVTAICYLTENFDGGEIVFPQHNLAIKPQIGMLVSFKSDQNHTHLVHPVQRGHRYSLNVWCTAIQARQLSMR